MSIDFARGNSKGSVDFARGNPKGSVDFARGNPKGSKVVKNISIVEKKKQVVAKINRVENYECVFEIGKIIAQDLTVKNDKSSYTINNNGFHIRISKLCFYL